MVCCKSYLQGCLLLSTHTIIASVSISHLRAQLLVQTSGTNQYIDYFDNPHGIIQGAIGSALAAGSVVGSLVAGPLSNRFGRRDSIFACFWWLIGTAVQVSCKNFGQLIAGRILNGVCVSVSPPPRCQFIWPKSPRRISVEVSLPFSSLQSNGESSSCFSLDMDALSSLDLPLSAQLGVFNSSQRLSSWLAFHSFPAHHV